MRLPVLRFESGLQTPLSKSTEFLCRSGHEIVTRKTIAEILAFRILALIERASRDFGHVPSPSLHYEAATMPKLQVNSSTDSADVT